MNAPSNNHNCSPEHCHCAGCASCRVYAINDVIELSPAGVLAIGGRMVSRGTVLGYAKDRNKQIVLVVRWHNLPFLKAGMVKPIWVQKPFKEERPFI